MIKKFFASALIFVVVGSVFAGTQPQFFNVDLTTQQNDEPTQIKLRIPIGMVSAMAPQIQEALDSVDQEKAGFDMRQIWSQIRQSGPTRFVSIRKSDMNITVDSEVDHVHVALDSEKEGRIDVKVKLALGDVLFTSQQPNVDNMIKALSSLAGQDLVTVSGDKVNGRIWID